MNPRTPTGVLGIVSIVALVVVGASTFVENNLVDVPAGTAVAATFATLAVVIGFVVVLSAVGIRGGRFLQNPYW